ncbi:MAG: hypothetical protein IJ222_05775 [Bacteroidales bacterium]|nr:hypothetical protein [Bacteroidales bacterium]
MKISTDFDAIVGFAREEAMRTGTYSIGPDHLFLGILRHRSNPAVASLEHQGIDIEDCKKSIDARVFHEHCIPFSEEEQVRLGRDGSSTVNLAIAEAMGEGADEADATHLLRAILKQQDCRAAEYLLRKGFRTGRGEASKKDKLRIQMPDAEQLGRLLSSIRINNKIVS